MTGLDKLIAAVEGASETGFGPSANMCDAAISGNWAYAILSAFSGSLDAALRLHEALLPEWAWTVGDNETTVWPPNDLADQPWCSDGISANADFRPPARAWLLAVLRALKAKGDA